MAGNVLEFTDENFQSEVVESGSPVLVDFWAPWCGPCRALAPTIEELAGEYEGKIRVGKMNTDESPVTATNNQISAIPTVLLYQDGRVVQKFVGVTSKDRFTQELDKLL